MARRGRPATAVLGGCSLVLVLFGETLAAGGWTPPRGGAVEMFRQMERAFHVGGQSGGAGGDGAPASSEGNRGGLRLTLEVAPLTAWDSPRGPGGQTLGKGTVRYYRAGSYRPELVANVGEEVRVPPGRWYVIAEAPGYVTAYSPEVVSHAWTSSGGSLLTPVVPACRLRLPAASWQDGMRRLDVVSLTEAAVYPILPEERETAVPAGSFFVYSVGDDGAIRGIGKVEHCEAGEVRKILPPAPPAPDRWSLVVHVARPPADSGSPSIRAQLLAKRGAAKPVVGPAAVIEQGDGFVAVFEDLPSLPIQLAFDERTASPTRTWRPTPGRVAEVRWPEQP